MDNLQTYQHLEITFGICKRKKKKFLCAQQNDKTREKNKEKIQNIVRMKG